jgi:hypothetical protein
MKNCRDEKEIPVCRIISHPISLMTADPKELFGMAFLRWIGGRREPMKNRRYNKLAAGSSAPIQSCFKISDKPNKRVGII